MIKNYAEKGDNHKAYAILYIFTPPKDRKMVALKHTDTTFVLFGGYLGSDLDILKITEGDKVSSVRFLK